MQKLYYGGDIITMVSESDAPEAVLADDGKIIYVGSYAEAKKMAGGDCDEVNLNGRTLMPSFVDGHSHISMYSQFSTFADLSACTNFQEIIEVLNRYRIENKIGPDGIIVGSGYDHNFLAEEAHPAKDDLNKVSEEIPVYIFHASGHMGVANDALLKLAGIPKDCKDPDGGHYGRYENGTLNGYVEEMPAIMPVLMKVFSRMKPDFAAQVKAVQDIYLKYGVTTVQDGGAQEDTVKGFAGLAEAGDLKLDVIAYIMSEDAGEVMKRYPQYNNQYRGRYKIGGAKILLDGSPQGKTAWLTKPYQGEETYCGYPAYPDETVERAARMAVQEGYQLLTHCNGDAASDQLLRAYKKALSGAGQAAKDLRPVMIHCQTVRDDQLDEMADIGMLPSIFVAHTYFWGDIHIKNLGTERGNHISPAKAALERGLKYNFHQDCPVLPPDMMRTVWCAVNRLTRKGVKIGEDQCIGVFDALKGVTINAAYAYHEEDRKGTLEAGKLADMIILEKNPLKADKMELKSIAVLETIKEGKTLYQKEQSA